VEIGLIEIDRHDGSTDVELMGESEHSICAGCIRAKLYVRLLKRAKEEKRLKNGESKKKTFVISAPLCKN
jgi:pyruvate/2-oxoacid:ferredoxin oxidoreductase beta subunit